MHSNDMNVFNAKAQRRRDNENFAFGVLAPFC